MEHPSFFVAALIKADATVKTHFVDPVLTAAIQHRLSDPSASSFATVLVKNSPLKVGEFFSFVQYQSHGSLIAAFARESPPSKHPPTSVLP